MSLVAVVDVVVEESEDVDAEDPRWRKETLIVALELAASNARNAMERVLKLGEVDLSPEVIEQEEVATNSAPAAATGKKSGRLGKRRGSDPRGFRLLKTPNPRGG